MDARKKLSKLVALTRRIVTWLSVSVGLVYFSLVVVIAILPATAVLTLAWNYAIVGMFTFTASVAFLQMFVLLACFWVSTMLYFFIHAFNRLRIFQWQTRMVQKFTGQQVQAEIDLMKHFNRGNPT